MTEKEKLMKRLEALDVHAYDLLRRAQQLRELYPDVYRDLIENIKAIEKLKEEVRRLK